MTMRRITIVTGANSGVGFGICQRLLSNLCHSKPRDAQPQKFSLQDFSKPSDDPPSEYEGIILIMACRSVKRAESAKERLYSLLDAYIEGLKANPDEYIHAKKYREIVDIRIHALDLAVMSNVFQFVEEILKQYPYVTDLICNAGLASFSHIHWPSFIIQLVTEPIVALTKPRFHRENQGELSVDGLGWVWQCNVFAHYCIFRSLQSLLKASPMGGRVVWTSSLAASSYESEDWQLIKTEQSYGGSKYQIDLMATHLDFRARKVLNENPASHPVRHFISEPGICSTNIGAALAAPGSKLIEICLIYIVRFLGSAHHTIEPYKAAVSAVHLILAPLWFFALSSKPVRYGSETDRWGKEYVGLSPVKRWEENRVTGEVLLTNCEALYQKLCVQERGTMDMDA